MNPIRTLTAREIECRISQIKKTGLQLLLYKDARCDMAILDETFGAMNWQRRHTRDNANCIISIWDDEKKLWIDKEDVGTESNTEAQKGLASDSFKRAGVNWGIGRELYTAPFIWIKPPNCEIKEDNGRFKCFDRFEVSEIGYNEHREINRLVIINGTTHSVVYEYGNSGSNPVKPTSKGKTKGESKPAEKPPVGALATAEQKQYIIDHTTDDEYMGYMQEFGAELENLSVADAVRVIGEINKTLGQPKCERCEKIITGIALPDGSTMTAPELIAKSKLTYNGVYCYNCMKELSKKKRKAG